jgi:hypothetical protein
MEENRIYTVYPSNLNVVDAILEFDEYLSRVGYKPLKKNESWLIQLARV